MKAILDFIIHRSEGVLRLARRIINFVRSLGLLNKTEVDEQLLKMIDFLLDVHPEIVKISEQFTISVLSQELKEHPEVLAELVDSEPSKAVAKLQEVVDTQAALVGTVHDKTFPIESLRKESVQLSKQLDTLKEEYTPAQLERAKAENYLRYGKYELPSSSSPIWHWIDKSK